MFMPKVSKIVIERLKAKIRPRTPIPVPGEVFAHADPNLLAAFVEKTLTERERAEIIAHLSDCPECRKAVALISPASAEAADSRHLSARWGWSSRQTLRWGALAATLGAVAVIVFLHTHQWPKQGSTPFEEHTAVVASVNKPSEQLPQPLLPGTAGVPVKKEVASRGSTNEIAKLGTAAAQEPQHAVDLLQKRQSKQKETAVADVEENSVGSDDQAELRQGTIAARRMSAMPHALSAPSKGTLTTAPTAEPHAALPAATAGALAAHVSGVFGANSSEKTAATDSSLAGKVQPQNLPAGSQSPGLLRTGPPGRQEIKPTPLPLWTISANGKVQRSEDGSKTWEEVPIADGITFRVITTNGADVWAGGSAGTLYHSMDGGLNWKQVIITSGGSSLTEAIVGIRAVDPLHVTVTAEFGLSWTSEDGGQHWQKAP
jgi:hypothetical protein